MLGLVFKIPEYSKHYRGALWLVFKIPKYSHKNALSYATYATAYATSSNINEGIKAVLFVEWKDFTSTKSTKTHASGQKQKKQF